MAKKESNVGGLVGNPSPDPVEEPTPSNTGIAWLVLIIIAVFGLVAWFVIRSDNEPIVEVTPVVESPVVESVDVPEETPEETVDDSTEVPEEVPTESETVGEGA